MSEANNARAYFKVASTHHFSGTDCLCGFSSAVARVRTEHILNQFLAACDEMPLEKEEEQR